MDTAGQELHLFLVMNETAEVPRHPEVNMMCDALCCYAAQYRTASGQVQEQEEEKYI